MRDAGCRGPDLSDLDTRGGAGGLCLGLLRRPLLVEIDEAGEDFLFVALRGTGGCGEVRSAVGSEDDGVELGVQLGEDGDEAVVVE